MNTGSVPCTAFVSNPHPPAESLEFRQLRHQTKNTLQLIMMQVLEEPGLCANGTGRRIAENVARRIRLSASVSDALFGLTRSPMPLASRVRQLTESLVALHADDTQTLSTQITVPDSVLLNRAREETLLRIIHELVVNAVKHGMHMRLIGHIRIQIHNMPDDSLILSVANDGWWMDTTAPSGEGLEIVRELARDEGGDVLIKIRPQTLIEIRLPRGGSQQNFRYANHL